MTGRRVGLVSGGYGGAVLLSLVAVLLLADLATVHSLVVANTVGVLVAVWIAVRV